MEVKPGYKQTEVGVIPKEWAVNALGKSCDIVTKGTTPTSIGRAFTTSGVAFLKAESISESGYTIPENVACIDETTHALLKRSQLKRNDLLISIAGVLGRVGLVEESDLPANTNQALAIVRLSRNSQFERTFVFYALRSPCVSRQIRDINVQAAQANISLQDVRDFLLPIPPLPEQRAIAAALSDVDALLGGLDRLIAKKRDLKQAAMQQLLTGQTRLPGFSGEWEVKRLGDVGEIRSGGTPSTTQPHFWDGEVPWCTPTDITALRGYKYLITTARTISSAGLQASSAEVIPSRSLIMTSRATIGACAINLVPMTTNQGFKNVVPFVQFDVEFVYYLMTKQEAGLVALCGGSTFLEIGKKQLSAYEISLPKDRSEQTAIAAVLSDMDAELASLEARRDKTRDLKQAMMQELLTGKTRLL